MNASSQAEIPLPEAALRLGISWQIAWRLVLRGDLKARKKDGRWLVEKSDVERLASERSQAQPALA